jgi:hypothetical protein
MSNPFDRREDSTADLIEMRQAFQAGDSSRAREIRAQLNTTDVRDARHAQWYASIHRPSTEIRTAPPAPRAMTEDERHEVDLAIALDLMHRFEEDA